MIKIINTTQAPNCIGPYAQAVSAGNIIFISGQIAICPETGKIPNNIEEQTYQILKNIKKIIQASGSDITKIIKTTIFTTNINNLNTINTIYQNFFNANNAKFPARSCVEISHLPKNAKIEIEAIGIINDNN